MSLRRLFCIAVDGGTVNVRVRPEHGAGAVAHLGLERRTAVADVFANTRFVRTAASSRTPTNRPVSPGRERFGRREARGHVDARRVLADGAGALGAVAHVRAPTTSRRVDCTRTAPQSSE